MALRYLFLLQAALYEKWTDSFHSTAERTSNCPSCQSSSYLKENKNMGKKIRSVRPGRRNGTNENIHLARVFYKNRPQRASGRPAGLCRLVCHSGLSCWHSLRGVHPRTQANNPKVLIRMECLRLKSARPGSIHHCRPRHSVRNAGRSCWSRHGYSRPNRHSRRGRRAGTCH